MTHDVLVTQSPPIPHSPRLALWTALEELHAALGMSPPTATLTIAEREDAVTRLHRLLPTTTAFDLQAPHLCREVRGL